MDNQYQSYQEMVIKVNSGLEQMEKLCGKLGMKEKAQALRDSGSKMAGHKFSVGILGEFKHGKSTVINSLLEKEIVPADVLPTSATMNRITYGMDPRAQVKMKDGSVKEIRVEELVDYVTKLDEQKEAVAADVDEAIVYYPCKFCQNGVDIIDTPGLNDDERMNKVTEEVIPKLDAVIMVLVSGSPFSMSEAEFVRNKVMASDMGKIIFLVNKMDQIRRESDKQKLLKEIETKIRVTVLNKMAEVYGEDAKEYKDVEMKLGSIHVYPFSAIDALDGKMEGDAELIEKSGTKEFEAVLTKMLTEDRGALELYGPLGQIQGAVMETVNTAIARKNALVMSEEEFQREQKQALEKIDEIRNGTKEKTKLIKSKAVSLEAKAKGMLNDFYAGLPSKAEDAVNNVALSGTSLKTDAGKKAAAQKMSEVALQRIQQETDNLTERILSSVKNELEDEAQDMSQFFTKYSAELMAELPGISSKGETADYVKQVAIDVATDYVGLIGAGIPIYGVGALLAGYKEAGVKGALVGGGVGVAVSIASLAVFPVVGIPAAVISCALGTSVGKGVVKKVFSKTIEAKAENELRSGVKQNVRKYINEKVKNNGDLEKWVDELINDQFGMLISHFEDESERMLNETEATMDAIKKDLNTNAMIREQKETEYDEVISSARKTWENLLPVWNKVQATLKGAQ